MKKIIIIVSVLVAAVLTSFAVHAVELKGSSAAPSYWTQIDYQLNSASDTLREFSYDLTVKQNGSIVYKKHLVNSPKNPGNGSKTGFLIGFRKPSVSALSGSASSTVTVDQVNVNNTVTNNLNCTISYSTQSGPSPQKLISCDANDHCKCLSN